jgi:hypothetical protein
MNDQEQQRGPITPEETGEGVFALTAPHAPTVEAVAFIVQPAIPNPNDFTETWIYSAAYVEPSEAISPMSYKFTFVAKVEDIPNNPADAAAYLRAKFPKFATGPINFDTHTVTRETIS